jgi:hypothetical protein
MRKYLIGAAAVLFPALLLYPRGQGFYLDWHNHVWLVGYFGEFFRQHHRMPVTLTTPEFAGLAQPIFYGYLFYPVLGLASMRVHPEIVVRVAAVLLFALQYVCVRKTLRRLGAAESLASAVACLMIWAIYGLTNLYNRSALTEFFAVGLVTCAVCSWFDLLAATTRPAVWRRALRFGLFFTLAAGTHPITAVYSLPMLAVLAIGLLPRPVGPGRLSRLAALVAVGLLGAIVLAPWLWAVHRLGPQLFIAGYANELSDLSDSIDHWAARLAPIPFDFRPLRYEPAVVSTPYLDAQINIPLLILGAALLWQCLRGTSSPQPSPPEGGEGVGKSPQPSPLLRGEGRVRGIAFVATPILYTAASLYLSLRPEGFRYLPRVFLVVQFLYRLVSYVNLALFLVLLFLLYHARMRRTVARPAGGGERVSPVLLCFVLTLSGVGVAEKLVHAWVATIPETYHIQKWAKYGRTFTHRVGAPHLRKTDADRQASVHLPMSFCGYSDYTTPHWLTRLTPEEEKTVPIAFLPVDWQGGRFGECGNVSVCLDKPGYVATEIAAFPWNRLLVDGQPVPEEQLRAWQPDKLAPWNGALQIVVPVPAGAHVLEHQFVPDAIWCILNRCAWAVLIGWGIVVGCWTAARFVRRGRGARISPSALPETPRMAA